MKFLHRWPATTLFIAALFGIATAPAGAVDYTITDLGTLGGTYSSALGINSNGQVVGEATTPGYGITNRAFLYSNGTMSDLGTLGGTFSYAFDINNNGQVVGWADSAGSYAYHAFLYSNGTMSDLGTLGGRESQAFGINNNGQVVGYANTAGNAAQHAFLYSNETMSDLGTLGGPSSCAYDINDNGQVVGWAHTADNYQHAFLYSNGVMTELSTFGYFGVAYGINNNGQVVGQAANHAVLYSNGAMTDLGTFGGTLSTANGINNNGQVVGYAYTAGNAAQRAFLYSGDSLLDLNNLICPGSGWTLPEARGINDLGQIVGTGMINGQMHAYLLTPVLPPKANAGLDQTVNEGSLVVLSGSGSSGISCQPLSHVWTQIAGPTVMLDLTNPSQPTFTAPDVSPGGETLTFQLIVNYGTSNSEPDVVNITVKNINHTPTANAGADQHVIEGATATLDGTGSFDVDGDSLTYSWSQTAGPSVTLSDPTIAKPAFVAPPESSSGTTLKFTLTVSDGTASAADSVDIVVEKVNHAPVAIAGTDQTVKANSRVTLDGNASSDPDADPLTYLWTQTFGASVVLSNSQVINPMFTAPSTGGTLVFQLIVNDGSINSASDTVTITVLTQNDPPACGRAMPSVEALWPPNHQLIPVAITGVTNANNGNVTIAITGVTQDEPVNGLGDGDMSPDAAIRNDAVLLRAERSGTGNGRVYQIQFTADDGHGGTCTGSVAVGVPHSKKDNAIDDGQKYVSTKP